MSDAPHQSYPAVSPFHAGVMGCCPRCAKGALFSGFLNLAPRCANCGLDYSFADAADGPAVFITLVAGFIVTGAALAVEIAYQPPIWVHLLLWLPLGTGLSLGLMRPFKGTLVALQYHHRAAEGRLAGDAD